MRREGIEPPTRQLHKLIALPMSYGRLVQWVGVEPHDLQECILTLYTELPLRTLFLAHQAGVEPRDLQI